MDNKQYSDQRRRVGDTTKSQVTFSKRRSSLLRKAHEIAVFCDVDIAVVAFSPSGRVSQFSSRERVEDVLERYVKLAPDKRYQHVRCLEWKLQKVKQLGYIQGDENKLLYLDNQIKNLELQIKKTTIELEILQTNLKEYEVENEENASLAQILWCEKNLKNSLHQINERKKRLPNEMQPSPAQPRVQRQGQTPFAISNFTGNQVQNRKRKNLTSSRQFLVQHDPRTWPFSSRVHNGLLEQLHQTGGIPVGATSSFAFNPLAAAAFPAIYHPGYPCFTQQTEIPPIYPPIQHQPCFWDPPAPFGVYGNSSMHQAIAGNPSVPFVPYWPQGAFGASNLYQPIMPGILDHQVGVLGGSSVQLVRDNHLTPGIRNQQPGALGASFLDQSLMGNAMTIYAQFQQPGGLGSSSRNDALLPSMSQLPDVNPNEVNPSDYTTQNFDVTPALNSDRVTSEPLVANNIGDGENIINHSSNGGNNNINISNCHTIHLALPTQENSPPESPIDSTFLDSLLNEAAIENETAQAAGNQQLEDNFMEWDGFELAENLNLEDLDIVF